MWTNLYDNHTESEHVRFPCDCVGSLESLRRDPSRSISVHLRCRAHSANNRGKLEVRQTSVAVVIDENAELAKGYR